MWDQLWEAMFKARDQWGRYPPEELVRFMARHYYPVPDRRSVRVLEVGCGPGAGPGWFVAREGFSYAGIDGSATAIERTRRRFLEDRLEADLRIGDAQSLPWEEGRFDCVIDIACLQCNAAAPAARIIDEIHRVLKPGGRHFSITTRPGCWGDGLGRRVDEASYTDLTEGPFARMGVVRFSTDAQLRALYRRFDDIELEHSTRSLDAGRHEVANWVLSCRKPFERQAAE